MKKRVSRLLVIYLYDEMLTCLKSIKKRLLRQQQCS